MDFKSLKKNARHTLKTHYFILFFVTLLLTAFGSEFSVFSSVKSFLNDLVDYESTIDKSFTTGDSVSNSDIIAAILSGDYKDAEEASERIRAESQMGVALAGKGGNRGIISSVLTSFSSDSILLGFIQKINSFADNESLSAVIAISLIGILYFIFFFMLTNLISVFLARIYLESSTYKKVPFLSAVHVIRVKRWFRAALTMFLKYIFQILWMLTVIGGIIKHFSYLMVPYIVAENPDIKPLEAITLSRRMMNGHKMEAFRLFLSFIGWFILAVLTLGILEFFYTAPYYHATFARYYREIRKLAKENNVPGSECLNDEYLFASAKNEVLIEAYPEMPEYEEFLKNNSYKLHGIFALFANWLGVWIGTGAKKRRYEKIEEAKYKYDMQKDVINKETYPARLNPLYKKSRKRLEFNLNWRRLYSIQSVISLFLIFCIAGWAYEVSLFLVKGGGFVNRGNLHGPWLPIYGFGGIIILTLLKKFRTKPWAELIATVLVCGTLEYSSAKYLEDVKLIRYWDYKGYFFNLDGRICMEGLIAFATMAFIIVYLVAPLLDSLLSMINQKALCVIAFSVLAVFIGDAVWSGTSPNVGAGITEDLSLGGWPETFFKEDALNAMSEEDKETLRKNIADVEVLQEYGVYPETLKELQEYQDSGIVEDLKKGQK